MTDKAFQPLTEYARLPEAEMKNRASTFYIQMRRRRTIRDFSDRPVDRVVIEDCLRSAATAPSGANQQPWQFVAVSDPDIKKQIRLSSEKVEKEFYSKQATLKWRDALKDLKTGPSKPFLETAPYLIAIFSQSYTYSATGEKIKHYYVTESVGIATGMLITALHHVGLATLTYTPVHMKFLNRILSRPANEKPFMILVVGYPSESARVPVIEKKNLADISVFI
jgi:iodotyrosine deiodinase